MTTSEIDYRSCFGLPVGERSSTVVAAEEKDTKGGAFPCFDSGEPTSLFLLSLSPFSR